MAEKQNRRPSRSHRTGSSCPPGPVRLAALSMAITFAIGLCGRAARRPGRRGEVGLAGRFRLVTRTRQPGVPGSNGRTCALSRTLSKTTRIRQPASSLRLQRGLPVQVGRNPHRRHVERVQYPADRRLRVHLPVRVALWDRPRPAAAAARISSSRFAPELARVRTEPGLPDARLGLPGFERLRCPMPGQPTHREPLQPAVRVHDRGIPRSAPSAATRRGPSARVISS
jgi:hypothetical protein